MASIGALPVTRRPLWARLIFALDAYLRQQAGVFEYSDATDCVFRVHVGRLSENVLLADGTVGRIGDRVIDLHFWNERIPIQLTARNSLAWGCRFNRCVDKSLRALAQFLKSKIELADVNIIRANTNLRVLDRIAERHGFEAVVLTRSNRTRLRRLGENILFWFLALACGACTVQPKYFWRSRKLLYLSRRALMVQD